jgi:hypothetical protein
MLGEMKTEGMKIALNFKTIGGRVKERQRRKLELWDLYRYYVS